MGKRISVDERIIQVRNERYDLLTKISDSIKNNRNILISDIKSISDAIEYDEKTVKRYEAVIKAQEAIASLTEELCFAQTEEEIVALRKKINNCISRIKAELKRRNVDENTLLKYQESANNFRKEIAKFIRVIKREGTITNLEGIHKTYESLSDEEKEEFMKVLRREHRYNQRNLYPKEEKNKDSQKNKEDISNKENVSEVTKSDIKTTIDDSFHDILLEEFSKRGSRILKVEESSSDVNGIKSFRIDDESLEDGKNPFEPFIPKSIVEEEKPVTYSRIVRSIDDINESDMDFLKMKIKSYDSRYNLRTPYEYGTSLFANIGSVIKNIPIYRANQKTIKQMRVESHTYYGATDFISYIAYLTRVNSIKHGLKSVFSRSYLYSSETQLLNDHNRCANWILDYCDKNELQINFLNRVLVR